jgi:putative ABC transport system permease protein
MNASDIVIAESFAALRLHPLRSFLTALTVTFGTAVLLVLMAYGNSAPEATTEVLKSMGSTQIKVEARSRGWGGMGGAGGSRRGKKLEIRYDDIETIRSACPSIAQMSPGYSPGMGSGVWAPKRSWPWAGLRGVGSEYLDVADLDLLEGRWFTPADEANREKVAVLNLPLKEGLFEDESPLGEWVESRGRRFTIIGVVWDPEAFGYSFYVPYTATMGLGGNSGKAVDWLSVKPVRPDLASEAVLEIRQALGTLYNFDPTDKNAVRINEETEFIAQVSGVATGLKALIWTISLVALVLGCLGAANVVGITVQERIAEIGLRKALGATPRMIQGQILAESLLLCVGGGVLGVAIGWLAVTALGPLALSTSIEVAPKIDMPLLLTGLAVLVLVGTFAGLPAARRAALLDPAVALRDA